MYDYKEFIYKPSKFSSEKFFVKEKKFIDKLQDLKRVIINEKKY